MSQAQLPFLARTETSELLEETGVQIAWALEGGRPVHIGRYAHLVGCDERPELTCLGCAVPVVPVLHRKILGRTQRQDHYRHLRASPACWAHHHLGAMLWNASLHLYDTLRDACPGRLHIAANCDPTFNDWAPSLPLFGWGCQRTRRVDLPPFDRVRLSSVRPGARRTPDLQLQRKGVDVLRIVVSPLDPMTAYGAAEPSRLPLVQVHVDEQTYRALIQWRAQPGGLLPASHTSACLAWRCQDHLTKGRKR